MPSMRSRAREDMASVDEVKVYDDEGEEWPASSENLSEDKIGLVIETEKRKGLNLGRDEDGQRSRSSPGTVSFSAGNNTTDERFQLPELPSALQGSLFRPYQSLSSRTGLNVLPYSHSGFEAYSRGNALLSLPSPVHLPGIPQSALYGLPHTPPMLPLYPPNLKDYQKWADAAGYPLHLPFPPLPGSSMSTFSPSGFIAHPSLHLHEFASTSGAQYSLRPEHNLNVHQLPGLLDSSRQSFYFAHHLGGHGDRDRIPSPRTSVKKKPVIKKPLNAFMLFMKEMRQKVIEEESIKESAAINQILGRRWHALSQAEQTKYYELAKKEKDSHAKMYPGWSARDNYAINSKRKRKRDQLSSSFLENQGEKHSRLSFDEEMWYCPEQSDNDKQSMLSSSSIRSANDCDI